MSLTACTEHRDGKETPLPVPLPWLAGAHVALILLSATFHHSRFSVCISFQIASCPCVTGASQGLLCPHDVSCDRSYSTPAAPRRPHSTLHSCHRIWASAESLPHIVPQYSGFSCGQLVCEKLFLLSSISFHAYMLNHLENSYAALPSQL